MPTMDTTMNTDNKRMCRQLERMMDCQNQEAVVSLVHKYFNSYSYTPSLKTALFASIPHSLIRLQIEE